MLPDHPMDAFRLVNAADITYARSKVYQVLGTSQKAMRFTEFVSALIWLDNDLRARRLTRLAESCDLCLRGSR
jgi:hypothetical protein